MPVSYYIQAIATLGIIGVGLYGLLKWTQAVQHKRFKGEMKIVDRLALDTQVALWVVEIKGKEYLVGVGGKEINIVQEIVEK